MLTLFIRDTDGTWMMPLPGIVVVPLFLVWLLGLLWFIERRRVAALAAGMFALGVAFFTHPSSPLLVVTMTIVTIYTLWRSVERRPFVYAIAIGGVALPLLVLIPWFVSHPETYPDTLGAWLIHKAHLRFPLDGLRANFGWSVLGTRLSIYWEMFNPIYVLSVIPWPLMVFIPIGIASAWQTLRAGARTAVFSALVMSPIPVAAFNGQHATDRALPFFTLLTMFVVWGVFRTYRLIGRGRID